MLKIDYHLHTEYSYDSQMKAVDLIDKAIALKYDTIAITEHLDLLPWELSRFGLPAFARYVKQVASYREQFASAPLRLVCGIEVGDFQRVRPFADELLAQLDFELILGAVHFIGDHNNVAVPMARPLSPAEISSYYRENLALVSDCDIHALAHLGVYKRYYTQEPSETHCRDILRDLFQTLIQRGIALEINYSAFRKPYRRLLPEPWQIDLYRSLGGNLFSLGSDSHLIGHFDDFYSELPPWLNDPEIRFPHF